MQQVTQPRGCPSEPREGSATTSALGGSGRQVSATGVFQPSGGRSHLAASSEHMLSRTRYTERSNGSYHLDRIAVFHRTSRPPAGGIWRPGALSGAGPRRAAAYLVVR